MPKSPQILLTATLLALALGATDARGNPHVWVETGITFELDGHAVSGLAFVWRFDDYYSAHAIRSYDLDGNGVLEAEEIAALRNGAFDPLAEFDYYVHVWARGGKLESHAVDQFTARIEDSRLVFEFSVSFTPSVDPNVEPMTVSVLDGSNVVDFRFAESDFLLVRGEIQEGCRFRVARGSGEQDGHPQTATLFCGG